MNSFSIVGQILRRDLMIAFRGAAAWARGLVFFILFLLTAALAIGPDPHLLARLGPSLVWLAVTFSALAAVDQLFSADFETGEMDVIAAGGVSLTAVAAGKAGSHFVLSILPILVICPLTGLVYGMEARVSGALFLSLLIGGPALSFVCMLAAALSVGARGSGFAATLLTLPLVIPTLIFGVAVAEAGSQMWAVPELKLLAAVTMVLGVTAVPLGGAALRAVLE